MKTMFKRLLPCLILVLAIFVIVSCGEEEQEYKYPTEVPLYTEAGNFVEIGNLKVSNKDVYNRLLQSYGIETLENAIDEKLLENVVLTTEQEKEFEKQINILKYGVEDKDELSEEEQAEALKEFESNMLSNGFYTDDSKASDPLYYKHYYRLEFKRYIKTLEVLKTEDIKFEDEEYVSYFNSNFHKTYDLIIVTFDSEKQAKDAMESSNIDITKLAGNWHKKVYDEENNEDSKMTPSEIKDAFLNMYELAYGKKCAGAQTYTYEDLYNLSNGSTKDGTILNRAIKLTDGDYTHGPLSYQGRYFVIYAEKVGNEYINDADNTIKYADSEANIAEKDANNQVKKLTEDFMKTLYEDVLISSLVSDSAYYENTIKRVMYKLRQDADLEIFAEGLELTYKSNYEGVFSALEITKYDAFKQTSNTSSTEVAKWNSGKITVNDMFTKLTSRYGALLSLLFVQQYAVLNSEYNTVVDYVTGEIKDNKKYEDYFEEDIESYKESFEEGSFASSGFPASYGWENFLRDYLGLSDEKAIIVDFNSTLYNDVVALYTKSLYTVTVDDVEFEVLTHDDGISTWGLKSEKWTKVHDTKVPVVDPEVKPTKLIAWEESDVEGAIVLDDNGNERSIKPNDYYGHFVLKFKDAEGAEKVEITPVTADQAVLDEYENIYNKTFSATASGLYVYYDADLDGVADEFEQNEVVEEEIVLTKEAKLANELINKIWDLAKDKNNDKTIAENLNEIVREYALANHTSEWAKYKQAGLRVTVINNTTYTQSSTAAEEVVSLVKRMWESVVEYEDELGENHSLIGQSLDPGYRVIRTSGDKEVFEKITPYKFSESEDAVYANDGYYKLAITKANKRTNKIYESSTGLRKQTPSLFYYDQYLIEDASDREETVYCTDQIKTYYIPAISALSSTDIVNDSLMEQCKELLTAGEVKFASNNDAYQALLAKLIEISLSDTE